MRYSILIMPAISLTIILGGCYTKPAFVELQGEVYKIGSAACKTPEIVWEKTFGSGFHEDIAYSISSLRKGGFLLAGIRYGGEDDPRKERVYMSVIDDLGEVVWDSTFWYYLEPSGVLTACEKMNGNLVLTGWTVEGGFFNGHLWEFDQTLHKVWDSNISKGGYYNIFSIIPAADSGLIAVGETAAGEGAGFNTFAAKYNASDRLQWVEYSQGKMNDGFYDVTEITGAGLAAAGYTNSWSQGGEEDAYIVRMDNDGKNLWSAAFGGREEDEALALCPANDGGFLLAGYSKSFGNRSEDIYIVKTNAQGKVIWENIYGADFNDRAYDIIPTDKGYLVAGYSETGVFRETDFFVMEIDEQGKVLWENKFGYKNVGQARSIAKASGGGYIIAGMTKPFYAKSDIYVVKLKLQ